MTTHNDTPQTEAKVSKLKSWSPVWIIPIVTILIGAWILFYHFSHQGPEVTLITYNAEGIEAGKTKIKSRSVDIGMVESVTLDDNFSRVVIKARLNSGMSELLRDDSAFWIVKPMIGRDGVTGLGTLLSGVFIELQPGTETKERNEFKLLDAPPLASPDAKGLRVILTSEQAGQLNAGDPILFRGYRVGSVETSNFDMNNRDMRYQLFINAPYDKLLTSNVRFWKDSGIAFDMSSQGVHVEMGSISTLLTGGVSFDVPEGWSPGTPIEEKTVFKLYDNQSSIENSLYTEYQDFVMFFSDSVRGLQPGAPVEFRGIRLGTVAQVPFYTEGLDQRLDNDFRIPVLIHIEPQRFADDIGKDFDLKKELQLAMKDGLRASLKSGNLLTGALFIDLDFYPNMGEWKGQQVVAGYKVIPTTSGGLAQIQQKVIAALDKINNMPIEPMLNQTTRTLVESEKTIQEAQKTLAELNSMMANKDFQNLPKDLQKTLQEMNRAMQGFQPGSPAYNKMVDNMQRLDQVLREVQPVLRTLNNKSNALVFEAEPTKDPEPKRAKK
ncbi:intermembrane transport protein PqiB [Moellerella wisconsensis]|uniref:Intermembrane transport protein PqiB n=1 Tax=Moellerella wisconsensis TaxID=158849 RepID=A0A9Q8Q2B5_9GAMM|nr:intermembrane transport protein PqiB [Moellerella wisconsensis]KLN97416.1 paraquat-inducible protein B [Moellerella wisconsensis]UNH28248.1 intermembrane transport protein PqiB [Moellerella wisconsensis]UNH31749.1 intermembrane transport protein PqiB [Moellerella wisconsensis]UNH43366.1 intermembrane transport protein PqiB [Moellerella wisconsensis]WJW82756.1 intermembrane transport protein PqiB [Moellerella wisconsensis]